MFTHYLRYMLRGVFFCMFCEQLEPVHQAKHSSSAVEVTACLSQVREIWLQLAWPDSAGAFIFITRLTDVSAVTHTHTHAGLIKDLTRIRVKIKEVTENFTVVTVTGCFIYYRISAARLFVIQR